MDFKSIAGADQVDEADFGALCPFFHANLVLSSGLFAIGTSFHVEMLQPMTDSHDVLDHVFVVETDAFKFDVGLRDAGNFNHVFPSS